MAKRNDLRRDALYGSLNVRLHIRAFNSPIRYPKNANKLKNNPQIGKALMLLTSKRGYEEEHLNQNEKFETG